MRSWLIPFAFVFAPLAPLWAAPLELVLQTGHSKDVKSLSLSADGKYLASGSEDGSAILWDLTTGQMLRRFEGHTKEINAVSLSTDGKRLATASSDRTIILWNTVTGEPIRTFKEKVGWVMTVSLSSDGKQMASGGWDNNVMVWDTETGDIVHTLKGHTSTVESVEWSPSGLQLLSASRDKTAIVWNLFKGEAQRTFKGHDAGLKSARYRANGAQIVTTADDRTAIVWDAATAKIVHTLKSEFGNYYDARFSPDSKQIVTVGYNRKFNIWDADTGKPALPDVNTDDGTANSVVITPDGKQIIIGFSRGIAVYDAVKGTKARGLGASVKALQSVALSADSKKLVVGLDEPWAVVWDLTQGKHLHTLGGQQPGGLARMALRADGERLVMASTDYSVIIWDVAKGSKHHNVQLQNMPMQLSYIGETKEFVVTNAHSVRVMNDDGVDIKSLASHHDLISAASISPNGQRLITGGTMATLFLWDVKEQKQLFQMKGHSDSVLCAASSPDNQYAATGSVDRKAIVWELATGKELRSFPGQGTVLQMQFSSDSKQLVFATGNIALLHNVAKGDLLQTFKGHRAYVSGVALSADGKRLVTSSRDGTARLWDVANGKEVGTLLTANLGKDWAIVAPDGTFDGSPAGLQALTFRQAGTLQLTTAAQHLEQQRPGLLAKLWQGNK